MLEQKRAEAQEIAELVTLSEMRLGSMLSELPKATKGTGSNQYVKKDAEIDSGDDFSKPKSEVLSEIGIEQKTAERFQRMAEHEEVVMAAIAEAREQDEIVTRSAVLKKIDEAEHKPHVVNNSGLNEWYTPSEIIEAAREVFHGFIDIDPASSDMANEVVKAEVYYTAETDGLAHHWYGNVWLNPPYSSDLVEKFIHKLSDDEKHIDSAIVLVNNATETAWFSELISMASAVCFPRSRIKYYTPSGKTGSPLQGQAIVYIGDEPSRFREVFSRFGWGCSPDGIYK